jgi:hypothetical protein
MIKIFDSKQSLFLWGLGPCGCGHGWSRRGPLLLFDNGFQIKYSECASLYNGVRKDRVQDLDERYFVFPPFLDLSLDVDYYGI